MKWVCFDLRNDETLQCDKCDNHISGQSVHVSIDKEEMSKVEEVLCSKCWEEIEGED